MYFIKWSRKELQKECHENQLHAHHVNQNIYSCAPTLPHSWRFCWLSESWILKLSYAMLQLKYNLLSLKQEFKTRISILFRKAKFCQYWFIWNEIINMWISFWSVVMWCHLPSELGTYKFTIGHSKN